MFWTFLLFIIGLSAVYSQNSTDTTVDPCNHFGKFICKEFYKKYDFFRESFKNFTKFQDTINKVDREKVELFSQPVEENEHKTHKFVKKFYQACIDIERQRDRGYEPLLSVLNSFGGIPFIIGESWNESAWSFESFVENYPLLPDLLFEFVAQGYEVIIKLSFEYFGNTFSSLERIEALRDKGINKSQIFREFSAITQRIKFESNEFDLDENETEESEITRSSDVSQYIDSVISMDTPCKSSKFCFRNFIPKRISATDFHVTYDVKDLSRLRNTLSGLSKKSLANFLGFLIINQLDQFLYKGAQSPQYRSETCLRYVRSFLFHPSQSLYLKSSFNKDQETFVKSFINHVQEDYTNFLDKSSGLEDATKNYMIFFIKNLTTVLHFNEHELEKLYNNLDLDDLEFFEMILSLGALKLKNDFHDFKTQNDDLLNLVNVKSDDELAIKGSILYIPPIFLDQTFISENFEDAINYANLGLKVIKIFLEKIVSFVVDDLNREFYNKEYNSLTLARNHTYLAFKGRERSDNENRLFWIALTKNDCHLGTQDIAAILQQLSFNVRHKIRREEFQEIYDKSFNEYQLTGYRDAFQCSSVMPHFKDFTENNDTVPVCETTSCILTASRINEMANKNISPCKNYAEHACGGFQKENVLNDRYYRYSLVTIFHSRIKEQRRRLLSLPAKDSDIDPFKLVKRYFVECTGKYTSSHLDQRGVNPLIKLLDRLGDFPLMNPTDWNEEKWNLNEIVAKFPLLYFWIYHFEVQSMAISIDTVKFEILKDISLIVQAISTVSTSNLSEIKSAVREFQKFMHCVVNGEKCEYLDSDFPANLSNTEDTRLLVDSVLELKNPCRINESDCFHNNMPENINWNEISLKIDSKNIEKVRKIIERTPKRIMANNIFMLIVTNEINSLSTKYLKFYSLKRNKGSLTKKLPQRWEICLESVFKYMPHALHALYYKKYMTESLKNDVLEFVNELKNDYITYINGLENLSENFAKGFERRVRNYKIVVGYADEIVNETNLLNYYRDWKTNEREFFELTIFLQTQYEMQIFRKLEKDFINLNDFSKNIQIFKESYATEDLTIVDNELYIFFLIFQEQFFSKSNLDVVNYGILGKRLIETIINDAISNDLQTATALSVVHTLRLYDIHSKKFKDERRLPGLTAYSNRELLYLIMSQEACFLSRENDEKLIFTFYNKVFECGDDEQ